MERIRLGLFVYRVHYHWFYFRAEINTSVLTVWWRANETSTMPHRTGSYREATPWSMVQSQRLSSFQHGF